MSDQTPAPKTDRLATAQPQKATMASIQNNKTTAEAKLKQCQSFLAWTRYLSDQFDFSKRYASKEPPYPLFGDGEGNDLAAVKKQWQSLLDGSLHDDTSAAVLEADFLKELDTHQRMTFDHKDEEAQLIEGVWREARDVWMEVRKLVDEAKELKGINDSKFKDA